MTTAPEAQFACPTCGGIYPLHYRAESGECEDCYRPRGDWRALAHSRPRASNRAHKARGEPRLTEAADEKEASDGGP